MLDAISLATNVMDEDLRKALVNAEAFEELDDNFTKETSITLIIKHTSRNKRRQQAAYDDGLLRELEEHDLETRGKETREGSPLAVVVEDYVMVQQELADAEDLNAYEYDENADTEDEAEPEKELQELF
ncbi:hypothetical protein CCR75_007213 [Bremia lactucae]|uniref:Uncharacterized protein n=1 Tax=Bremia lactucae TaxID=4779 RepID=A0A976FG89_BRELC|nr:hypothetical protein CCR75_007213 [Bremia lactucae]